MPMRREDFHDAPPPRAGREHLADTPAGSFGTSSGSILANIASQITASSSGPATSCGKRTSASFGNSPRSAARLATLRTSGKDARHDVAVVELGDRRKARTFGDDEAQQQLAPGPQNLGLEHREEDVEDLRQRQVRHGGDRLQALIDRIDGAADQALEQRLLVLEVEVERALGDAGPARHLVEPCRLVAVLGEHRESRVQDCLPPHAGVGRAHARLGPSRRRRSPRAAPARGLLGHARRMRQCGGRAGPALAFRPRPARPPPAIVRHGCRLAILTDRSVTDIRRRLAAAQSRLTRL